MKTQRYKWERNEETPDPGQYHKYHEFTSGAKSFRIGDQRMKSPGAHSAKTVSRSRTTFIATPVNHFHQPREDSPDPGQYAPNLSFNANAKSRLGTLRVKGRDPLWKVDTDHPHLGPGRYNHESDNVIKKRVAGGLIKPPPMRLWEKPKEVTPCPG